MPKHPDRSGKLAEGDVRRTLQRLLEVNLSKNATGQGQPGRGLSKAAARRSRNLVMEDTPTGGSVCRVRHGFRRSPFRVGAGGAAVQIWPFAA